MEEIINEVELSQRRMATNGIELNVVQAGPEDGPLVILLHGFPEFWYGWREQIEPLAKEAYRVWVPDQRGYNLSDKPKGVRAYSIEELAADIIGLMDAAGAEKAFVVGHDWGAMVAWWLALQYPERLERLVIVNVPHPVALQKALMSNPRQFFKSWYAMFFQIPWLPEKLIRLRNWRVATQALKGSSRPGTFSQADLEEYRRAWAQSGAMHSMLNWYRAAFRYNGKVGNPRVSVPTLILWGIKDKFLTPQTAQASLYLCDDGQLVYFEEATHWVQHEEAAKVNRLIIDFIGKKIKIY